MADLGFWNLAQANPEKLALRSEAVEAWVAKGAQLSPTVKSLMRRAKRNVSAGVA